MSEKSRQYYLQQMGIETWVLRGHREHQKNLVKLAAEVSNCVSCPLHLTRSQTIFSRGNPEAQLMIIGGSPNVDDDQQGLPFVGKAGALLNKIVSSIGLSDNEVYMANVLKCRVPDDNEPTADIMDQCCNYLLQQITLVAPKVILAIGQVAGQFLLKVTLPLNKMRSQVHHFQGIPVLVSYHPVDLLCHPGDKKNAYNDWLAIKRLLES